MLKQELLEKERRVNYSYGAYNKFDESEQWIRITEGCPNQCPYCYEPREFKVFGIPEIVRNQVKVMDMNLLAKPEALDIIRELGRRKVGGKVVYYELICGLDYRFMTQEIAKALKEERFQRPRIAWDWGLDQQYRIKDAILMLEKAGYVSKEIMIFMICNWKITQEVNLRKLDLCKVWRVKAADCYYDNQTSPNIQPVFWTVEQIKEFRRKVRDHNQLVNFGIDPDIKLSEGLK